LLGDGGGDLSQVSFGDAQGVGRLSHVDGMSQRLDGSAGVGVDFRPIDKSPFPLGEARCQGHVLSHREISKEVGLLMDSDNALSSC
jgi:hypothetical protein